MARFNNQVLEEIRSRIDIGEYIGARIPVKRAGSSFKACCPFHGEKTPSFTINPDRGRYHCFGCGESGDVISFLMKYEGIPFHDAVMKLAEQAGIQIEQENDWKSDVRNKLLRIHAELATFYQRCLLQTKEAQVARDYLVSRQLESDIVEQFQIGYAPAADHALERWAQKHNYSLEMLQQTGILKPPYKPGRAHFDLFRGRLVFPICDKSGRVIAFSCRDIKGDAKAKYINSPETEIFKKSNTLYAFNHARGPIVKATPRQAIVCEGQIDVIRCHAAGFNTAIASQGTAFTEEHVEMLKKSADSVLLVFDSDKAGRKAAIRTMRLFLAAGVPVRIATLPEGEDPDSLIRSKGRDAFQACLDAAESPAQYQYEALRSSEKNPTAIDAIQRIASELITTIAPCPEPILCAAFLQEASSALGLPLSAFERDLENTRSRMVEDEARRARFRDTPPNTSDTRSTRPPPPSKRSTPSDPNIIGGFGEDEYEFIDDLDGHHTLSGNSDPIIPNTDNDHTNIPIDEDYDWAQQITYGDEIPIGDENDSTPQQAPINFRTMVISESLMQAFCELLVHHFHEQPVMDLLIAHLPPIFVRQPYAAKLYTLACDAYLKQVDLLNDQGDDPAFSSFLNELLKRNSKVEYAKEATSLDLTQQLVKRFWILECDYRRHAMTGDSNLIERLTLSTSIKRFETLPWDAAAHYMNAQAAEVLPSIKAPEPPKKINQALTFDNIPPPPPPSSEPDFIGEIPDDDADVFIDDPFL